MKSYFACRAFVSVMAAITKSKRPPSSAVNNPSNAVCVIVTFTPSTCASALARSGSRPTMVLLLLAKDSKGG
jgi:hypothetical protein